MSSSQHVKVPLILYTIIIMGKQILKEEAIGQRSLERSRMKSDLRVKVSTLLVIIPQ